MTSSSSSTTGSPTTTTTTTTTASTGGEDTGTGGVAVCDSPLLDSGDRLALADAPMRGNPDGLVTIVGFIGYECPFSRIAMPTIATLMSGVLGSEIRFVAKQRPLDFQDPEQRLARAAVAADQQGLFWELHDAMFEHDGDLDEATVEMLATDVGIDVPAFRTAMDSPEVAAIVAADIALFTEVGASGTPSFIINGELVVGAQQLAVFEAAAATQLEAMQQLIEGGLTPCEAFEMRLEQQLP